MTDPEEPTLDDVLETHEDARPDRHEHGKEGKHLDDDALEQRTEQEQHEADVEQQH